MFGKSMFGNKETEVGERKGTGRKVRYAKCMYHLPKMNVIMYYKHVLIKNVRKYVWKDLS